MTNTSHLLLGNPFDVEGLVYIRQMDAAELNEVLPPNALADVEDIEELFAVLSAEGERLAIVQGRDAAFAAARAHSLKPLSVH